MTARNRIALRVQKGALAPHLSIRIHRELRAAPLTDRELAERLGARMRSVAQTRLRMLKRGTVRPCGYGPRRTVAGHTPIRYVLS